MVWIWTSELRVRGSQEICLMTFDCLINDLSIAGCGGELFPWDLSVLLMFKLGQNISGDGEKIAEHEGKITFDCLSSSLFVVHCLLAEAFWPCNEPWIRF